MKKFLETDRKITCRLVRAVLSKYRYEYLAISSNNVRRLINLSIKNYFYRNNQLAILLVLKYVAASCHSFDQIT